MVGGFLLAVLAMALRRCRRRPPAVFDLLPVADMPPDEHERPANKAAGIYPADIEVKADAAGVGCDTVNVSSDDPAQAIVDTAKKHHGDAVWMASRGRRGMAAVLRGSETRKVLTDAGVPVVVFR